MRTLVEAVKAGALDELVAIFGPDGKELVDASDPATARRNREVFTVAAENAGVSTTRAPAKVLVVGNEDWPFPVRWRRTPPPGGSTPPREKRKCSPAASGAMSWR